MSLSATLPARMATTGRLLAFARQNTITTIGLALIALYSVLAVFVPWIAPYDPIEAHVEETATILQGPSARFWFGTDGNGMDVFSRVVHGSRFAFGVAIPATLLMLAIGVPIGLYAGYRGGIVDEILLRVVDVLRAFPALILALAVVAATGQSLLNVILVIGLIDSPTFARLVRAEVLALRSSGFVEAAIAMGNPTWRILFLHLLPNAIRGTAAQAPLRMALAIRATATLAFFGVGIQAPSPEWGVMIRQGAEYMITGQWWVSVFPGLALLGIVVGFNLLGDGLQEQFDPKGRWSSAA